jgi:hypothetical protein
VPRSDCVGRPRKRKRCLRCKDRWQRNVYRNGASAQTSDPMRHLPSTACGPPHSSFVTAGHLSHVPRHSIAVSQSRPTNPCPGSQVVLGNEICSRSCASSDSLILKMLLLGASVVLGVWDFRVFAACRVGPELPEFCLEMPECPSLGPILSKHVNELLRNRYETIPDSGIGRLDDNFL